MILAGSWVMVDQYLKGYSKFVIRLHYQFTYSSGKTTKLSLQNLPPDDCLRFVMKQETECGAAL